MYYKWYSHSLLLFALTTISWGVLASTPVINIEAPDLEDVLKRVDYEAQFNGRDMTGVIINETIDFFNVAALEKLENGISEWTLEIFSKDANGLCVYFNDFHIPVGGSLYFESPEGAFETIYQEGPIDESENNEHGRWASGDIPGEVIRIVYRQTDNSIGNARLGIMGIGYFIRGVNRGSDVCEVDVMCPEGDSWQCERDATVRLRISQEGGIFYCSGSMVNNTALDCRQLLLSAFHCADAVAPEEWAFFKVRFNYEYLDCGGTTSINSHVRTGVLPLSNSADSAPQGFNGSDFLLVEVEDPILASWNPFFAGFDASGDPGHSGVGIHHPGGDRKKISAYTNTLSSYNIGGAGSHWRVYWVATETNHGVTEGGSSGSPIFSENHHIVGTLSSGLSACVNGGAGNGTGPFQPDFYGKLSYHWDGPNPIPELQKLKYFLNPSGSGQDILDGSYVGEGDLPCGNFHACSATEIEGEILEREGWGLSPNPAIDRVEISMPEGAPLKELRVYDSMGRLISAMFPESVRESYMLDTSKFPKGLLYLTVRTSDGTSSTRKLIVE